MIEILKNYNELYLFLIQKEELPIYCCGPTIYSNLHKGNYRSLMLLDYIYKVREKLNLTTKIRINITDIDDKIFSWFSEKPISNILENTIYQEKTREILEDLYANLEKLKTSYKKWKFIRISEELEQMRKDTFSFNTSYLKEGLLLKEKEKDFFYFVERRTLII